MKSDASASAQRSVGRERADRLIGAYGSKGQRPLVIVVAGLHGNEPGGVEAVWRVFERLERNHPAIRGRLVGFRGNVAALQENRRYIDRDMNRMWCAEEMTESASASSVSERREQLELLRCVEEEIDGEDEHVILLDLHSTSAETRPFCIISDTVQNRRVAFPLAVPVVLGLEEAISGTMQEYVGDRGITAVAVEGGQHANPVTADYLEAALWIALVSSGLLQPDQVPLLEAHHRQLRDASRGLSPVVEVIYRHGIADGDGFVMKEGFSNFCPVRKGEVIARDRYGSVAVHESALLVMPSYQGTNEDGFFLGRRVRPGWLKLSAMLRGTRADHLLPLLPGVRRHPDKEKTLIVDPIVARWLVLEIFHLMGFRRRDPEGDRVIFQRRPEGERAWPPTINALDSSRSRL